MYEVIKLDSRDLPDRFPGKGETPRGVIYPSYDLLTALTTAFIILIEHFSVSGIKLPDSRLN